MESRPALGEKLADRRIWARRAQKFYLARPRMNECRLDSVFLIPRPVDELGSKGGLVQLDRLVQVCHRDPDVVDLGQHH
jgi:hypothetical protein